MPKVKYLNFLVDVQPSASIWQLHHSSVIAKKKASQGTAVLNSLVWSLLLACHVCAFFNPTGVT